MLVSEIPALRNYWYNIGVAADIGDEPFPFRIFGERYVAWRTPEGISATADECPHRAARLSQGWLTAGCLVCPYHGWTFEHSGTCVDIPAAGPDAAIPPRAHLTTVPVRERYGFAWVCVGADPEPLPELPEAESPDFVIIPELMEVWRASAPRITDNALDVGHVAFVHRNSVGSQANPTMSDYTVEREGSVLRFSVTLTAAVNEQQKQNLGLTSDLTSRTTHAELVNPFVFRGVLEYHENGLIHVLFKTATPIDDDTTLFCQFIARNDKPTPDKWEAIADVDRLVQSEDKRLLEEIRSDFPLDVTSEVHVKSDRMTIEYRRVLADLATGS